MIRRFRYALSIVRDISMILCPASASVRARVDEVRDADLLAERWLNEKPPSMSWSRGGLVLSLGLRRELVRGRRVASPLRHPAPDNPTSPSMSPSWCAITMSWRISLTVCIARAITGHTTIAVMRIMRRSWWRTC